MKYIVETPKSVEQAVADLQAAVQDHKFGVLHIHRPRWRIPNQRRRSTRRTQRPAFTRLVEQASRLMEKYAELEELIFSGTSKPS